MSTLKKIKTSLQAQHPDDTQHEKYLLSEFEKLDPSSQGTLDIANFKTCLLHANLGLGLEEVVSLAHNLDKDSHG